MERDLRAEASQHEWILPVLREHQGFVWQILPSLRAASARKSEAGSARMFHPNPISSISFSCGKSSRDVLRKWPPVGQALQITAEVVPGSALIMPTTTQSFACMEVHTKGAGFMSDS
mmetsp:Transcript_94647/g.187532  ORF Transcript_94647/g.187532 Transcript_94647/m.187532 type:complete len:117 (+) Transcript_94647:1124-1474(+)